MFRRGGGCWVVSGYALGFPLLLGGLGFFFPRLFLTDFGNVCGVPAALAVAEPSRASPTRLTRTMF